MKGFAFPIRTTPWGSIKSPAESDAPGLLIPLGIKMTQMENKIVLARFKDGYGPVGAWFLLLKSYATNAYGEKYEPYWFEKLKALVGDYVDKQPVPTCLRNHAMIEEIKAGKGPICNAPGNCITASGPRSP